MARTIGGEWAIRFWNRKWNKSRTSTLAQIYTLASFGLQVAISGVLLGLGVFFVVFYENYLFLAISKFGYPYFLGLTAWIIPHLVVTGAMIGFLFAYFWYKMAPRPCENSGFLIFSALLNLGLIAFCIGPFILVFLMFITVPDVPPASMYDHLFLVNMLNLYFMGVMTLVALPSIIVLIAGGGAYLRNYWSLPPVADTNVLVSPRGVRTSHSVLAEALHGEKDKTRRINRQRKG